MDSVKPICLNSVRTHGWNSLLLGILALAGAAGCYFLSGGMAGILSATSRGDSRSRIWCLLGAVVLLLAALGLLFQGLKGLFAPGNGSLSKSIRSQLPPEQQTLPPHELFALVDRDLSRGYQTLLNNNVLAGQEWLLFRDGSVVAMRYDCLQQTSLGREKKKFVLTVTARGNIRTRVTVSELSACQEALALLHARAPQMAQMVPLQ